MINKDINFTGVHADLLKKYSVVKNQNDGNTKVFLEKLNHFEKGKNELIIFDSYFNSFVFSSLLGIKNKRKVKMDTDSSKNATIFTQILVKNAQLLRKIFQYITLLSSNDSSLDENIKKAFAPSISNDDVENFTKEMIEYSCAGLEYIDNLLNDSKNIEDVLIFISQSLK